MEFRVRPDSEFFNRISRRQPSATVWANHGNLPKAAASGAIELRRFGQTMPIQIIPLRDEWIVGELQICVRSLQLLPAFARDLIDELVAGNG